MKGASIAQLLREIIGGTPAEVGIKLLVAAIALLWDNLAAIGASVFLYFCMLVIDAMMGAALALRAGTTFRMAFFVAGPFKKFALTAGMLFVGAVVDSMIPNVPLIPDTPVFIAVATFVGVTTCLDVARKYGQLTGSRLIVWLEQRLGRVIKTDDEP